MQILLANRYYFRKKAAEYTVDERRFAIMKL